MEVKKSTKEFPIHSNSFTYLNNNNNNNNNNHHHNHPSSSPPLLSPNNTTTEKKTLTLDPGPSPSPSPSLSPSPKMIRYRECQRNHAAHLGSHVVDGCGEFMPSGEGETPLALKCAACNCHRNFHRREVEGELTTTTTTTSAATSLLPLPPPPTLTTTATTANCYISFSKFHKNNHHLPPTHVTQGPHHNNHHHHNHPRAPVMMAFGGGAAESSSEDLNAFRDGNIEMVEQYGSLISKKRYRTKFSQDQKHKMMDFAEKIGWRIQKQDDVEVQRFCNEVGVKRQVFKVWMHNNKQALKKKQPLINNTS